MGTTWKATALQYATGHEVSSDWYRITANSDIHGNYTAYTVTHPYSDVMAYDSSGDKSSQAIALLTLPGHTF